MFPASSKGGGKCVGFPDVVKIPAPPAPFAPAPFPNMADLTQANGGTCSSKVKILNKEVCTTKTEISMSSGDEAGTAGGGMISSKIKGPALFKKGSSKVKVEGAPIVHLTSMTALNGGSNANTPPGAQVEPSQTKVTVKP
ncbi:MAG TPA: PAAR-like domain-containing protein [Planctomycetota bacterium]